MEPSAVEPTSPDKTFKAINLLYFALLGGQLLFLIIGFFMSNVTTFNFDYKKDALLIAAPILAISSVYAGIFLFKSGVAKLAQKSSLKEKLTGYTSISLVRFALIEAPVILSIVAFIIGEKGNLFFIAIAVGLVLYYGTLRPSKNKMKRDLKL